MLKVFLQRQKKRQKPGFAGYLDSVGAFMFQNGFLEYGHAFDDDIGQQDILATWVEYAFFAHCYVERAEVSVRLLQPTYDEAWRTLEAAVALEPFETPEYVRSESWSREQHALRCSADKALATAELELDKPKSRARAEQEAPPPSSSESLSKWRQRAVEAEEHVGEDTGNLRRHARARAPLCHIPPGGGRVRASAYGAGTAGQAASVDSRASCAGGVGARPGALGHSQPGKRVQREEEFQTWHW